jgi:hypothetical protein
VSPESTARELVSIPREFVQEIVDYRFSKRMQTKSVAIRALIRAGLDAGKAKLKKK